MTSSPQAAFLPTPDSYRVPLHELALPFAPPGALLAGEYPGAPDPAAAWAKATRFAEVGVDLFLDLTEAGEYGLRPYAIDARAAAVDRGRDVRHVRYSIRDMGTPTRSVMATILDAMDAALAARQTVYVHCFGGIGRTGTVVGCWLARHGTPGEEALAMIREWRRGTPDGWRESPETTAQREMVLAWNVGE